VRVAEPDSAASSQFSKWDEARVFSIVDIAVIGDTCLISYSENLSEKDWSISNTRTVIQECGSQDPLFTFHKGDIVTESPILVPFDGGFFLAFHHGMDGPILIKFNMV